MRSLIKFSLANLVLLFTACLVSCSEEKIVPLSEHQVIPRPEIVQDIPGSFRLDKETVLVIDSGLKELETYLVEEIDKQTGITLVTVKEADKNFIRLSFAEDDSLGEEGYRMEINEKGIDLKATTAQGLFYAIQTLKQLLPIDEQSSKNLLASGKIEDRPSYAYRGMMLDVARHFFGVEDVKHLIDQISTYKINHLHLHLSDDQGWRIEIKSWPLLTTVGAANQVGGGKGGFYTQEDYKEIVRYAQSRYITIVPEIDMPGHTNAVLNAYGIFNPGIKVPEKTALAVDRKALGLEEDPKATPYHTGIEVGFSTLDINNQLTYQFVEDVIREISDLTPGPYFHIGGDESHVTAMKDYIPFIEKAQALVTKYGKKTLGWDEIAHAQLLPGSVAQYWAKASNAVLAIEQGAQVLISPAVKAYLDMQYDSTTHIGLHWAAYVELDEAYNWDPTALDDRIKKDNILGVEAPLWTETVVTREDLEFLTFPRLVAIAEIAWTDPKNRSWEDFSRRILRHEQIWEKQGVNFYRSPKINRIGAGNE